MSPCLLTTRPAAAHGRQYKVRRGVRPKGRTSNPLRGCSSDLAQYSNNPALRVAGFQDEDENEVPCIVSCHSVLRLSRSGAPLDPIFRDTGDLQNQQPT
jgi:hypothetical protein